MRGPSLVDGPDVERVHVQDADDVPLAWIEGGWRRFDLQRLRFDAPGTDDVHAHDVTRWTRPRIEGPDPALRARILDLVDVQGALDPDAVVRGPHGDHWLVFQVLDPLGPGGDGDFLSVVDRSGERVLARPVRADGIGPLTVWPPWYSPDGSSVAVTSEWGASIHVFETRDWTQRWSVASRTGAHDNERLVLSMPNERRLYACEPSQRFPGLCQVFDLQSGAVLFHGRRGDLVTIDGTRDDSIVVAKSMTRRSALIVLDGADFSPLYEVWLSRDGDSVLTTAHAADGTFDALLPQSRELFLEGTTSMSAPATAVAPWLLDPLHVRTFQRDADRTRRRVPLATLRVVTGKDE